MLTTRVTERQNGFTLLEVLIAVSFIAVGLLAAAAMQGTAITANSTSNRLTVANMLAQQASEEIISRNCSTVNNPYRETAFCDATASALFSNVTVSGAGAFSTVYTITPNATINGTSVQGLTRVDVVVSYMTGSTANEAAVLTTYKSNEVVME